MAALCCAEGCPEGQKFQKLIYMCPFLLAILTAISSTFLACRSWSRCRSQAKKKRRRPLWRMARISKKMLVLDARRQAIPMACVILFIAIYFPAPCNAGNALRRYARDSAVSAVRRYALPPLLNAAEYAVNTRLGQAAVEHYNTWLRLNGVQLEIIDIPGSHRMPCPPGLFPEYIIAAKEALENIDKSAPLFQHLIVHIRRTQSIAIHVYIIDTDSTPKSGMKTYQTAEKIVSEMEKESLINDFTKLMEVRGSYKGITVGCVA